jgi:cyanophycinase-like exopeptidase
MMPAHVATPLEASSAAACRDTIQDTGSGRLVDTMTRTRFVLIALAIVAASPVAAQQIGPKSGSLVIVGGNMQDDAIVKRFIDLAGGPDAPIVVIPTAGDDDTYDEYWSGLRQFRENGARHLSVLHTRDRKVADTDAFVKPIQLARGVQIPTSKPKRRSNFKRCSIAGA